MTRLSLLVAAVTLAACGGGSNDPRCGDGEQTTGELCDDGNNVSGDGCSALCALEAVGDCGNGVVEVATETCDDGNTSSGDGCSGTCQDECGNGQLDGIEECDDGAPVSGDGCSAMCVVEADYTCTGEPSSCQPNSRSSSTRRRSTSPA